MVTHCAPITDNLTVLRILIGHQIFDSCNQDIKVVAFHKGLQELKARKSVPQSISQLHIQFELLEKLDTQGTNDTPIFLEGGLS